MFDFLTSSYAIERITVFDQTYKGYMESIRNPILTDIMITVTHIGDPAVLLIITALILLLLWIHKRSCEVIVFAGAMCGGAAIVWILKHMVQRIRPIGIISETGYSFPSGHALMASIFFPLVYYVFKYSISSRWYRGLFFWGNTILMIAIILSRPYIGVHYISDVVVGALIGLCITSFSILIVEGYYTKK